MICTNCEQRLKFAPMPSAQPPVYQQQTSNSHNTNYQRPQGPSQSADIPNVGANIASCCSTLITCFPIVGIILYFVWKDEKPKAANSVCIWSLVPFIFIAIFYILFIILGGFATLFRY